MSLKGLGSVMRRAMGREDDIGEDVLDKVFGLIRTPNYIRRGV